MCYFSIHCIRCLLEVTGVGALQDGISEGISLTRTIRQCWEGRRQLLAVASHFYGWFNLG